MLMFVVVQLSIAVNILLSSNIYVGLPNTTAQLPTSFSELLRSGVVMGPFIYEAAVLGGCGQKTSCWFADTQVSGP